MAPAGPRRAARRAARRRRASATLARAAAAGADEIRLRGAAQPRERDGRGRGGAGHAACRPRRWPRRCAASPGVPHRLEEVGTRRRRALRERLEGHQRRRRRCAAIESFEGGVHAILGGSLKGGGFEGLRERRGRALPRLLPDRRGRRAAGAGPRPGGVPLQRCGDLETAVRGGLARPPGRARWCCSRRPARATTSSATTRSAASASGRSCREHESRAAASKEARMAARAAREATGRVLDPLHRHALPAGGRGGDGLLGQLGGVAAERQRRPVLLPQALRDVRARSGWWCCTPPRGTA